jgi:hypothetical protein
MTFAKWFSVMESMIYDDVVYTIKSEKVILQSCALPWFCVIICVVRVLVTCNTENYERDTVVTAVASSHTVFDLRANG